MSRINQQIQRRQMLNKRAKQINNQSDMVDNVKRVAETQNISSKRWCLITANERRIIMFALSLLERSTDSVTGLCVHSQPDVIALGKAIRALSSRFKEENWMEQFINELPADIKVPKHSDKE